MLLFSCHKNLFLLLSLSLLTLWLCPQSHAQNAYKPTATEITASYKRMELLDSVSKGTVLKTSIQPGWQADGKSFWYKNILTDSLTEYDPNSLNTENLSRYDGLIIYANHNTITNAEETAMKELVEGGKALIPLHAAAFCFQNSDWYINAVGGQFSTHKYGTFTAPITKPEHPVMAGLKEFETSNLKWNDNRSTNKTNSLT